MSKTQSTSKSFTQNGTTADSKKPSAAVIIKAAKAMAKKVNGKKSKTTKKANGKPTTTKKVKAKRGKNGIAAARMERIRKLFAEHIGKKLGIARIIDAADRAVYWRGLVNKMVADGVVNADAYYEGNKVVFWIPTSVKVPTAKMREENLYKLH